MTWDWVLYQLNYWPQIEWMEIHYNHSTNIEFAMRLNTLPTQLLMPDWVNGKLIFKQSTKLRIAIRLSTLPTQILSLNFASIIEMVEYSISLQILGWLSNYDAFPFTQSVVKNWVGRVLNLMAIFRLVEWFY